MTVDADQFKQTMRHLGAAVTIVATQHEGRRGGLTATAVCSVTTAPPTLLVSINRSSSAYPLLARSRAFSLNVLAASQIEVARKFGASSGGPEGRFAHGTWTTGATGSPILQDSLAVFDCMVVNTIDVGTHTLFLATPLAVLASETGAALGYLDGQFISLKRQGGGQATRNRAEEPAGSASAFFDGLV